MILFSYHRSKRHTFRSGLNDLAIFEITRGIQKRVKAELINVHENCGKEDFQISNLYDIVPKEEIAEFEDIMRKIITGIISEASGIATWVYVQKYEKHKTLDEMLQEWQGAGQFIIVMDTWFEKLMAE